MDSVMRCLTSSSSSRPYTVSTHPGPSTFTRMWGAADWASARLKLYTPPFTAQNTWLYSPRIAPVSTWSHDMLRMTPPGGCSRSEEHTSELQSSQISYAVFCLKKKKVDHAQSALAHLRVPRAV